MEGLASSASFVADAEGGKRSLHLLLEKWRVVGVCTLLLVSFGMVVPLYAAAPFSSKLQELLQLRNGDSEFHAPVFKFVLSAGLRGLLVVLLLLTANKGGDVQVQHITALEWLVYWWAVSAVAAEAQSGVSLGWKAHFLSMRTAFTLCTFVPMILSLGARIASSYASDEGGISSSSSSSNCGNFSIGGEGSLEDLGDNFNSSSSSNSNSNFGGVGNGCDSGVGGGGNSWSVDDYGAFSNRCMGLSGLLCVWRLTQWFWLHPRLGALLITIRHIVTDVAIVGQTVIVLGCVTAFSAATGALLRSYPGETVVAQVGQFVYASVANTDLVYDNAKEAPGHRALTTILMILFLAITLLLFQLLMAMIWSKHYQIANEANVEWRYSMVHVAQQARAAPLVPPPFNLLVLITATLASFFRFPAAAAAGAAATRSLRPHHGGAGGGGGGITGMGMGTGTGKKGGRDASAGGGNSNKGEMTGAGAGQTSGLVSPDGSEDGNSQKTRGTRRPPSVRRRRTDKSGEGGAGGGENAQEPSSGGNSPSRSFSISSTFTTATADGEGETEAEGEVGLDALPHDPEAEAEAGRRWRAYEGALWAVQVVLPRYLAQETKERRIDDAEYARMRFDAVKDTILKEFGNRYQEMLEAKVRKRETAQLEATIEINRAKEELLLHQKRQRQWQKLVTVSKVGRNLAKGFLESRKQAHDALSKEGGAGEGNQGPVHGGVEIRQEGRQPLQKVLEDVNDASEG